MGYIPFRGNAPQGAIRRILKMAFDYFRLGYIELGHCPAVLEPSAGARNWRKAFMKILRNAP